MIHIKLSRWVHILRAVLLTPVADCTQSSLHQKDVPETGRRYVASRLVNQEFNRYSHPPGIFAACCDRWRSTHPARFTASSVDLFARPDQCESKTVYLDGGWVTSASVRA
ncbi:hypothetical protein EDD15DRAFT_2207098 [Pisolithus albus]|nr:hypothetical protein EDD15DRAFT_2207098 [Pisolithus albus]